MRSSSRKKITSKAQSDLYNSFKELKKCWNRQKVLSFWHVHSEPDLPCTLWALYGYCKPWELVPPAAISQTQRSAISSPAGMVCMEITPHTPRHVLESCLVFTSLNSKLSGCLLYRITAEPQKLFVILTSVSHEGGRLVSFMLGIVLGTLQKIEGD